MSGDPLRTRIREALAARGGVPSTARRLFDGYLEGHPGLVLDLYGRTLVVHDRAEDDGEAREAAAIVAASGIEVAAAIRKPRHAAEPALRNGIALPGFGASPDREIVEHGVRYAIELTLNRDASFYLDTRELRRWLGMLPAGARVLNTFAYTGSLGVAARAAGSDVVHLDRTRRFLDVARASYALNGWPVRGRDFRARDFFVEVAALRRERALFDVVIVDPPFFSAGPRGTVDLERGTERLLNKVRPLVADGGRIVVVHNALYVSGAELLEVIARVGRGGYVELESIVPPPPDVLGPARHDPVPYPADPSPFVHPTKIAVLRVRRKDGRGI